jgi:hypothetical protein
MSLYTSAYTGAQIDQAIKNPDNKIINGAFQVNQRTVTSTVTLSAGVYGHDMWKAGASGCTYTFAASGGVTTLTISAGSLQQVVEGVSLETDTYCLSWTGTAQGKIGAGSYGASGITGAVTGGTNLTVEFGTGTLAKVKLEQGAVATPFRMPGYGEQLALCRRYYRSLASVMLRSLYYAPDFVGFPMQQTAAGMRLALPTLVSTSFEVFSYPVSLQTGFTLGVHSARDIILSKVAHGLTDVTVSFTSGYLSAEL